ncbi:MAG: type II toxin-antitoxin system PemK/MazF family toxin, partial [Thermoleophilaceae bacterium]
MKRGEVYWARLAPRSGLEQMGRRPVIVLSHDAFNKVPTWRSVIVVPVSSSLRQAGRGPTTVPLPAGVGGLERDGVALCHQVTTLDRGKLAERIGHVPVEVIAKIDDGLKAALGMV